MNTSEKIKELRIKKGLSQEALGQLAGVQRAAINKYEKGRVVNIKRSTLQKLATALGVSPADLLDDEENYQTALASEIISEITTIYTSLDHTGQEQLVNYGRFLLTQREK